MSAAESKSTSPHSKAGPTSEAGAAARGTAAPAAEVWAPPAPDLVIPSVFPDSIEVLIYSGEAGPTLVAAVELVSPANKDRPQSRRSFGAKCASYLQQGVGLVTVDIVTNHQANLHNELMRLLETDGQFLMGADSLYAVAYRPSRTDSAEQIETWTQPLRVGGALPLMPVALNHGIVLPLDLESTYTEARERRRMG